MKLVASMMVGPGEWDRYLGECLAHLLDFCDGVCVRAEDDGRGEFVADDPRVSVINATPSFFQHEGRARQELLDFTLQAQPTHVLAIDADEFVTDGAGLRAFVEESKALVFTLQVEEVWKATPEALMVRMDGGWAPSQAPILWKVPVRQRLRINNRAGGCGREPVWVRNQRHRQHTGHSLLHFGWTNEVERAARYARYADRSAFGHNPGHVQSIMWDDSRVKLQTRSWDGVPPEFRGAIVARANRGLVPPAPPNPDDFAVFRQHAGDGRWVGLDWDGNVKHGVWT